MEYLSAIKRVKSYTFPCVVDSKNMDKMPEGVRRYDEKNKWYVFDGQRCHKNGIGYGIALIENGEKVIIRVNFPIIDRREGN